LLHLMGTLDRPSAGEVRLTGLDVAVRTDRELSALRAASIGFVFQQYFLAEHASALDNVADGLLYAGAGLGQRRTRAADALAQVDRDARWPDHHRHGPATYRSAACRPGQRPGPATVYGQSASRAGRNVVTSAGARTARRPAAPSRPGCGRRTWPGWPRWAYGP